MFKTVPGREVASSLHHVSKGRSCLSMLGVKMLHLSGGLWCACFVLGLFVCVCVQSEVGDGFDRDRSAHVLFEVCSILDPSEAPSRGQRLLSNTSRHTEPVHAAHQTGSRKIRAGLFFVHTASRACHIAHHPDGSETGETRDPRKISQKPSHRINLAHLLPGESDEQMRSKLRFFGRLGHDSRRIGVILVIVTEHPYCRVEKKLVF